MLIVTVCFGVGAPVEFETHEMCVKQDVIKENERWE